jgi:hypothetical protein
LDTEIVFRTLLAQIEILKLIDMGRKICGLLIAAGLIVLYSCSTSGGHKEISDKSVQNKIVQDQDGTISLKVDKADCYQDAVNPASNTAEWSVKVLKSGRFNVWLSTATRDTTDLKYTNSVMLNILDHRIEAHPSCDKIIRNSADVSYPYFRADSFLGSLYIQDTGLFNVQIISEKILTKKLNENLTSDAENSKLLSVFLTPIKR